MKAKLLEITWKDTCSHGGWRSKDFEPSLIEVVSLGVLFKETKEFVAIAQSIDSTGQPSEVLTIPKVNIKRKRILK